uniref:P53 and DNA damage-regulated protein 1 n=1 Tax=Pyrodinium bahamense TaxID=73915 RepID=A0A7S0FGJ6_9DINO|mmetsp:Transcript_30586/g.84359  ORF Transcript_30586/g.84359 Transcript_30586/m.84359 type:complete len:178 (+) Transcript_30586:36-569(+)
MLDRGRLLRIEALADEVLRTQENLIALDREQNGRREALGCFRRGEMPGGTHWVATEGQFLRLPASTVKEWLHGRHEDTKAEVAEARVLLKTQTQALLSEHPAVTDLHPGVCELLLQAQQPPKETQEEEEEEREVDKGAASERLAQPQLKEKRGQNALDYSRFDHIADSSDSDGEGRR